jgi:HlyD family secretion protein
VTRPPLSSPPVRTSLPVRPWSAVLLALLAALAAPALAQEGAAEGAPAPEETAAPALALPAISVTEVATHTLRDRVIASGLVAAVEQVQVQPLVEGQQIDELLAEVGDRVEADQVLARLSTSTLELQLSQLNANRASVEAQVAQAEASLAQAEANAAEAERQERRNAELAEAGTLPRAQAEQAAASAEAARAAVRVAEQGIASAQAQGELVAAQIENAELQLRRTEVRAPVGGLVVARNAQVGAIASASGAAMFTIVRDGAMELRAEVSEQDLLRLAPGQTATLRATAQGRPFTGEVRLVEPAIDPQTRLGVARISIDDPTGIVEGMFLTAEVLAAEEEVPAVPVTALGSSPDGATVMRVTGDVVEQLPVTSGLRDGALVGITEGLEPGDLVVTRAAAFVRDGDRINPIREGEDLAAAIPAAAPTPAAAVEAAAESAPESAPEPDAAAQE